MTLDMNNLEDSLFQIIDQFKFLIAADTWENILVNCSKNEILVLMLIYRNTDVNMTQIADYLQAPLNTATGIVTRMEKRHLVHRLRNNNDKRVVTIVLTETGQEQMQTVIQKFLTIGQSVFLALTPQELDVLGSVIGKIVKAITPTVAPEIARAEPQQKVRKITIE